MATKFKAVCHDCGKELPISWAMDAEQKLIHDAEGSNILVVMKCKCPPKLQLIKKQTCYWCKKDFNENQMLFDADPANDWACSECLFERAK